jgi:hypothetical protein
VSDGDVLAGARISPNLQGPLQVLKLKRNTNHIQTRPAMENAEVRRKPSRSEQKAQLNQPHVNARYNLRSNTTQMAKMGDACDSHRQF